LKVSRIINLCRGHCVYKYWTMIDFQGMIR
jgi:hypothetical protein